MSVSKDFKFVINKGFYKSLKELYQRGGKWQKKAGKAERAMSRMKMWNEGHKSRIYPLEGLSVTNHGETRIDSCVKYDLNDGVRLITIQNNGLCTFMFVGDHDECDRWLERKKGLQIGIDSVNNLKEVHTSKSIREEGVIYSESDYYSEGALYKKLPSRYFKEIFEDLKPAIIKLLKGLESTFEEQELMEICELIELINPELAHTILDVFIKLKSGDADRAKYRIDLYKDRIRLIGDIDRKDIESIEDSEEFFSFENFEPEMIEHYLNTSGFKEWMIFLHPEQRKIVDEDYNGPTKLAGVSGSGKTAIIVKRAIRLAKKYRGEKILIVTLNKALANLIKELILIATPENDVIEKIDVKSFWTVCKDELAKFEKDIEKRFNELTWKHNDTVEEIWNEYYYCEKNNNDADVFYPVHQSLLSRGVNPRIYIKQEFDWIRSAFLPQDRENKYMDVVREGRSEPLTPDYRELMLKGLMGWEEKMEAIGVIDYTGLAARLHRYKEKIKPKYRCILIDELQDFGTMELAILRQLAPEDENDMFLCGDIAQQVLTKHQKISHAGINIIGRSQKIRQNYRNSREILKAAYEVLHSNVSVEALKTEDFEIIVPEYANFSTSKPLLIKADSVNEELGYALSYIKKYLEKGEKACIAIAGLSFHQIKIIGENLGVNVLDDKINIDTAQVFLSDLEQTKGFEFDMMFVLNCKDKIIPNYSLPKDEWHRDICKLYVALTRAKKELFVSYNNLYSSIFSEITEHFTLADWNDHVNIMDEYKNITISKNNKYIFDKKQERLDLTAKEFLYTDYSIGLDLEVQNKLLGLVKGKHASTNGKPTQWPTVYELYRDRNAPNKSQLMGPVTYKKFKKHIENNV